MVLPRHGVLLTRRRPSTAQSCRQASQGRNTSRFGCVSSQCNMATVQEQKPFVLRVALKFQSTEDRDKLLAAWKPLAEHVRANEEETLAYEALIMDSNPLQVVIFERYARRAYLDQHNASEPFKAFFGAYLADDAEWRKQHPIELSLETYSETGIGHLSR